MPVTSRVASPRIAVFGAILAALFVATSPLPAQDRSRPLVPPGFRLAPAPARAIAEPFLTPEERRDLRVFHGVWDDRDLDAPARAALAALLSWDFDAEALRDPAAPALLRAEARLRIGEPDAAIAILEGDESVAAARIRAEAHEAAGRFAEADAAVEPAARALMVRGAGAVELTEGVRALMVRARVRGQPARDFQTMVTLLGRAHQDIDRLYWPARLAEAMLLVEKDNSQEGVQALHETLDLNPRASDAWAMLGQMALRVFDFDAAALAIEALRRINPTHPAADLLAVEMSLVQDDPEPAAPILAALLERYPHMRQAMAADAALAALRYDEAELRAALARLDAVAPGTPMGYFEAGRHLSLQRQYELAAELLGEAARRLPGWAPPAIELGLLEVQSGRDAVARAALAAVVEIDPYNRRAANSLELLERLAEFEQIESRHFLIRWRPGVDEVVARLMPDALDAMHDELVSRFQHVPDRKTVIELMPDHQFFSVRITGMPWIHTIAACTGPVIALEAPRMGPPHLHLGPYDWLQVLRHEYAHTITLSQTRNRIPHWLTEAAAVSIESSPRRWETCQMLAREWRQGTLFDLDEINWAFVRPRRPQDRSLAYAQGAWMVEFMNQRFGDSALVRLIERYFDGVREDRAMPEALGLSREEFLREFLVWAGEQVRAWGLAPEPALESLADELRAMDPRLEAALDAAREARLDEVVSELTERIGQPRIVPPDPEGADRFTGDLWPPLRRPPVEIDEATLDGWLAAHPDHPDLIEMRLRRDDDGRDRVDEATMALLERYAALRPVDPYPHRRLARHHLAGEEPQRAVSHLAFLDAREEKTAVYALELARLHRAGGDMEEALASVTKAVRVNGYDAATRELAAAIAIEAERADLARLHLQALVVLEPDREIHRKRLEAVERLGG